VIVRSAISIISVQDLELEPLQYELLDKPTTRAVALETNLPIVTYLFTLTL
jgi:hypothetical protein